MAAGLVAMTVRSSSSVAGREAVLTEIDGLRTDAVGVIDADRDAYGAVLALTGRRDVEPEAFRTAVVGANRPPLEITRIAADVASRGQEVARASNPDLRGDVTTALILADAAATAAVELVAANTALGGLTDDDLRLARRRRERIRQRLAAVVSPGDGG